MDAAIDRHVQRIGERVRGLRSARGMSRRDLSRDASISERYLAALEGGQANPSLAVLRRLSEAMDLELATLVGEPGDGAGVRPELRRLLSSLGTDEQAEALGLLRERFGAREEARRGIALIGLRGAGKTTLGQALAERFGVPFVRLGDAVVRLAGMDTAELFSLGGQKAYRRLERAALEEAIATHPAAVVEAGGSLVSESDTYDRLRACYRTVWVRALPEEHMQRVVDQGDTRPMRASPSAMEDLRRILEERESAYRLADHTLDTSGRDVPLCLEELVRIAGETLEPREVD